MFRATATARVCRRVSQMKINIAPSIVICRRSDFIQVCIPRSPSCLQRHYSNEPSPTVNSLAFDQICNETLESLCDYFEEIVEKAAHLKGADITYGDGVLTVKFGAPYGTYVINRQSPNKQIWLSSPTSGPKRYDLVLDKGGYWIYKHDGVSLHQLLQKEIPAIVKLDVNFGKCSHSMV